MDQAVLRVASCPPKSGPDDSLLPLLFEPAYAGQSLVDAFDALAPRIADVLPEVGGVLLRGFAVPDVERFRAFAAAFGDPLLSYEFGSTPRSTVSAGIYTSTEYPAHQHIPLHNEQAYTREWPMRIWFHCVTAAAEGGQTPIADSRAIYRQMPDAIRERFAQGLIYVRNYGNGLDVPWQDVFNTEDPAAVEAYCAPRGITCEWKDDGELRTTQHCQGVARHPDTGDHVWFNQAHLFHVSNLAPEVRESLEDAVGVENLPRNVLYADGAPIPDADLDTVRRLLQEQTIVFDWRAGDVLMLDNMLAAHARTPFSGARKVVVAMARSYAGSA
ncbi:TauD/TfdA family dioxygenase [Bordetella genomosp. 13]|uniref:TauD/TfdA-like domain-containing protein n=1 Tax=Bordetella genomosp. 13 TaxID=463040 RepID=A0A1W6Z9A4_9BORD|nr:TauD/TfdA family dioxygenase [Bordetella genomosp. 13]ARP93996.1 hypothetical protein CAL15_06130 [Bordetella genomosp. 13]